MFNILNLMILIIFLKLLCNICLLLCIISIDILEVYLFILTLFKNLPNCLKNYYFRKYLFSIKANNIPKLNN